jgi:phosphoribosylformylglycinamidine synthase
MSLRPRSVRITVLLSSGVNDPQGNTVRDALRALGHADVRDVRVGKVIDLVLDARDTPETRARAEQMCQELLANPVIETYRIDVSDEA